MGKLEDCLSTLSIIATCNIPEAAPERQAAAAVQAYIDRFPEDGAARLVALRKLQDGLRSLKLESTAGAAIWRIIEDRRAKIEAHADGAPL